jgi:hypothetical protein
MPSPTGRLIEHPSYGYQVGAARTTNRSIYSFLNVQRRLAKWHVCASQ